jgi:RNA polymerase sigma-70 factor (family 1)
VLQADYNNDQQLLERVVSGDPQAYHVLYDRFYDQLVYFVHSIIHDRAAAEDIAVDTFISLMTAKPVFPALDKLKSWLFTTAHRRCLNLIRDDKRHRAAHMELGALEPAGEEAHDLALIKSEAVKILQQQIEQLSPQIRQVIRLSFLEGKSVKEIAAQLGTAVQTTQNQKNRGLQLLRHALLNNESLRAVVALTILQASQVMK